MSGTPALYSPNAMRAEKRAVAGNSVIAAFLITAGKVVVGVTTGSLGILSEAAHSALDLVAALLFSTDVWSAGVVVLGLVLILLGRIYHLVWLRLADPIAALFVGGVIVSVSWRLARRTIDALLDAAPAGVRAQIIDAVSHVDGVLEVGRVRIRRAGNRYFADLAVRFARTVTFQRSQHLVAAVTAAVHSVLKDADVTVQPLPRAQRSENIFDRIRAVATRHNLNVHDISVQDLHGHLHVEQHVELDERLTLKTAHDQVTELEADMRRDVPEIADILTHIESEPATIETGDEVVRDAGLERQLKSIATQFPEIVDMHDIQIKKVRGRLYVSCHCTLSDDLSLARVHDIQTELEIRFKQAAPELFRVLIHPEPSTDNRR